MLFYIMRINRILIAEPIPFPLKYPDPIPCQSYTA